MIKGCQTFIRGKNHFVKLPSLYIHSKKWVLIKGPWFDVLNRLEFRYSSPIILHRYPDCSKWPFPTHECEPDIDISVNLIGEKTVWIKKKVRLWETSEKTEFWDVFVCNGGIVPYHLRCANYDKRLSKAIEIFGDV